MGKVCRQGGGGSLYLVVVLFMMLGGRGKMPSYGGKGGFYGFYC
jgi:hypothetical protein